MTVIKINDEISIDESELSFDFVRSSGPGGQNVNKVSTAVQLRFDVINSASLSDELKARLIQQAGKRINQAGVLVIEARSARSQETNRQAAVERFANLVRKASRVKKPRRPTNPSAAAKRRRLDAKRKRSELKRSRGRIRDDY